ncbi:hypothetical protein ACHAQJ_007637 [Trichoderma viride]
MATMPPKSDDNNKQQQCWECLRRSLACDGCRPVCDCCRSAGIVCPGYENRRPLTWVTPGNVTVTRIRKARAAAGSAPTPAASKRYRLQMRPQLLSPPELSLATSESKALSVIMPNFEDKTAEYEADPESVILEGNNDGNDVHEEGDDEGEDASNSDQTSSSPDIIIPQTRATSLALVSPQRRWSTSTRRRSIISIPPDLQSTEFELMDAVDYCVLSCNRRYLNQNHLN